MAGLPEPLAAGLALGGLTGLAGGFIRPFNKLNGINGTAVGAG
jgi:hypothetical protein